MDIEGEVIPSGGCDVHIKLEDGSRVDIQDKPVLWMYAASICMCCGCRERVLLCPRDDDKGEKHFAKRYGELKALEAGQDVRDMSRLEIMFHDGNILSVGLACKSKKQASYFRSFADAVQDKLGLIVADKKSAPGRLKCGQASAYKPDEARRAESDAKAEADRHMQELLASEDQSLQIAQKQNCKKAKAAPSKSSTRELPRDDSAVAKCKKGVTSCKNKSLHGHGKSAKASAPKPDEASCAESESQEETDHNVQAKTAQSKFSTQGLSQECSELAQNAQEMTSCQTQSVHGHDKNGQASAPMPDETLLVDLTQGDAKEGQDSASMVDKVAPADPGAQAEVDCHMLASEDQSRKSTKNRHRKKAKAVSAESSMQESPYFAIALDEKETNSCRNRFPQVHHWVQELLAPEDQCWEPAQKLCCEMAEAEPSESSTKELAQDCSAAAWRTQEVTSCKTKSVQGHGQDGHASTPKPNEVVLAKSKAQPKADRYVQEPQDCSMQVVSGFTSELSASALIGDVVDDEEEPTPTANVQERSSSEEPFVNLKYGVLTSRSRAASAHLDVTAQKRHTTNGFTLQPNHESLSTGHHDSAAPTREQFAEADETSTIVISTALSTTQESERCKRSEASATTWRDAGVVGSDEPADYETWTAWRGAGVVSSSEPEAYETWTSSCCNEHGCRFDMSKDFCTIAIPSMPKPSRKRALPPCPAGLPPPPPKIQNADVVQGVDLHREQDYVKTALNASTAQQAEQLQLIETLQNELKLVQQRLSQPALLEFLSDRLSQPALPEFLSEPAVVSLDKGGDFESKNCPELASPMIEFQSVSPYEVVKLQSQKLPSLGSADHHLGTCKPCAFFETKTCRNSASCKFCHLCTPDGGKKKHRQKLNHTMGRVMANHNWDEYYEDKVQDGSPVASTACCEDAYDCSDCDAANLLPVNLLEDLFDDHVTQEDQLSGAHRFSGEYMLW